MKLTIYPYWDNHTTHHNMCHGRSRIKNKTFLFQFLIKSGSTKKVKEFFNKQSTFIDFGYLD